jgi:hypothetical protein
MMRAACEAFGVTLQAIGGALCDYAVDPVVEAVRELEEYRAENERLREDLIAAGERSSLSLDALDHARTTIEQREREIADYDVALGQAKQELQEARVEYDELRSQLQECRQELNSEKRYSKSLFTQAGDSEKELDSMRAQRDAFAKEVATVVQREVEAQNKAFQAGWEECIGLIKGANWIIPRTEEVVRVMTHHNDRVYGYAYASDEWHMMSQTSSYHSFIRLPEDAK